MTVAPEVSAGLRAYPAYRDSGVPWIGEVPTSWGTEPLKSLVRFQGGHTPRDEPHLWNGGVPWVSPKDMKTPVIEATEDTVSLAATHEGNLNLHPSESVLLVVRSGILRHKLPVALNAVPATVNQDMKVLRCSGRLAPKFLYYFFEGLGSALLPVLQKVGATVESISMAALRGLLTPVPPFPEQQAIAAFLNRETARIDELLREQEALLEDLAMRRDALVFERATKGLGGVPLQESGVAWAGQVPAHWEVVKLRSIARLESGHTPSRSRPEYWENCTIPWVSLSDVRRFRDGRLKYIEDTEEKISELGMAHSSARLLPRGTVILSRTASVGFSAILGIDMATTQDFANWVCGPRLLPEYLLYVLRGMKHEFARLMMGSTHQTIYMPDIRELQVPLPPPEEQQAIVQHLNTQLAQIDALTEEVRGSIALMRQHRSVLITAAVTGKIDVRSRVSS